MKIAKEIAIETKQEFEWINADGYSDEELEVTVVDLGMLIAAKLEPVRGEICNLKNIADEAGWDFDSGDRGLALMGINRLLALFDEE